MSEVKKPKRSCLRCGRPIHESEFSGVKYCSEKCSQPTVQDFRKWANEADGGGK
jgi:endogenous inhibitor of DNA gyrase (YacG/DUF329 family)